MEEFLGANSRNYDLSIDHAAYLSGIDNETLFQCQSKVVYFTTVNRRVSEDR